MRKVTLTIIITAVAAAPVRLPAEGKLDAVLGVVNKSAQPASKADARAAADGGSTASEVLAGNGTRAGYVLGHGSVIPGSEWVYIGLRRATRSQDYTIDYASGTLFFTEPVRQSDSVRVDYRYAERTPADRSVTGPGALAMSFGSPNKLNTQMGLLYNYRAAAPERGAGIPDLLTYGVNAMTKLGESSSLSSLMYVAAPQNARRISLTATPTGAQSTKVKKDRLMLQNADLGMGKVRLKLGYQNVGQDFAGFAALRESNAAPTDVLNQLEKEKGIKRMSVALDVPAGSGSAAGSGLSFSINRISDSTDDITSQAFSYSSDRFAFNFGAREVGSRFARFKDLKEADRAQLAAELGMKRTNYGLLLRTGTAADSKPVWSSLSFTQLKSDTGSLSYRAADLDLGKLKVQADVRKMDPTFNRMAALTDEERTRMALIARRQFNPKAQAADVTPADKAKVNLEAGLDRTNYIVQMESGQLNTWLSLSSIASDKGELSRSAFSIENRLFSLDYSHHSIDSTFSRLSSLQPIELSNYGNEYGMTRSSLGLALRLAGGKASFSNTRVTDHQGASVLRRAIDFNSQRLKFRANLQDIDPRFSRIMDLSDSDRAVLAKELGFRRSDYWINLQVSKALNIDSYLYDSTNATAGQAKSQTRHKIVYSPISGGPQITMFQDDYAYFSEDGNLSSYSRRKVTFDKTLGLAGGLLFKSLSDITTSQEGGGRRITTVIEQRHLESDQKASTSFTADTLDIDHDDGRFENTRALSLKTKAMRNVSLTASYANTDRDSGKSETNGAFGFDWVINKDLKMGLNLANRDGGVKGSQQARQFSLSGLLAKRFLLFDNIRVGSGINTTQLTGRQIGCDNALKLEAGFLGGSILLDNSDRLNPKNGIYYTSRIFQYESSKDPKRWYHLTFFRQNLITPSGQPAEKRNYALDMKFSSRTSLTFTSYLGKDGQNGAVLPTGGTVLKINHLLANGMTLTADYSADENGLTGRRARTTGFGFSGTLSNKAVVEFYYGWATLFDRAAGLGAGEHTNVFRIKYDHKMDADHFITLTAQKKSGIDRSTINPYEGDTVARIDFGTVFD